MISALKRQAANVAFEDLLDVAQISEIRLVKSTMASKIDASAQLPDAALKYSCKIVDVQYDPTRKTLLGTIDAEAVCIIGRRQVAKVAARYVAVYAVDGEPDVAVAQRFFHAVGKIAVYPYFRAHFAALASQAGLHLPPLPIMKTSRRAIAAWAKDTAAGSTKASAPDPSECSLVAPQAGF